MEEWHADKGVTEKSHDLLACKGGTFTGAPLHWSVTEKEAYPIVKACEERQYLRNGHTHSRSPATTAIVCSRSHHTLK
jgi:hypothetical protein